MLEWTGKRYTPWVVDPIISYDYLHRYRFAREFIKGKKVLDLACGEGYGSFMLAEEADEVIGADIDQITVGHASSKYIRENLRFIQGSIIDLPIKNEGVFDVIVCFEVLEHIKEHDKLMKEVKRLIKSDGIFIISTPNKSIYSDQPNYPNPFHLKELYFDEFKNLLNTNFKNTLIYGQKIYPASNIFPLLKDISATKSYTIEKGDKGFLSVPPERKEARYFIGVSSDGHIRNIGVDSYLVDISESLFKQFDQELKERTVWAQSLEQDLKDLQSAGMAKDQLITDLKSSGITKDQQIANLEAVSKDKEATLNRIYESHGWKALEFYYIIRAKILPENSKRLLFIKVIFKSLSKIKLKKSFFHTNTSDNSDPYQMWINKKKRYSDTSSKACFCNVCGWEGENFIGSRHSESLICPECGSISRNRMLYAAFLCFLRDNFGIKKSFLLDDIHLPFKIIEISPRLNNPLLTNFYKKRMNEICSHYIDTDYSMNSLKATYCKDLQNLSFGEKSIDFILCSHVIEYISDDKRAFKEMFRVLKWGGAAFFQMPILNFHTTVPEQKEYHEDAALAVRRNGWDVVDKMRDAGFEVSILVCDELFLCFESFPSNDFPLFDKVTFYGKYGHHEQQKDAILHYPFVSFIQKDKQNKLSIYPFGAHEVFLCHKKPFNDHDEK